MASDGGTAGSVAGMDQSNKRHNPSKVPKKRAKNFEIRKQQDKERRNKSPKAFGAMSMRKGMVRLQRKEDLENKKFRSPLVAPLPAEEFGEPPFVVVVCGPPGVGKSTLIRSLVKHYTRHNLGEVRGPVTVVSGKRRRLTFFECPQDLNAMIDLGKIADLCLLLVDAKFGFEMETFEMLNVLQTHGFPKIMGVLTHLDQLKTGSQINRRKKELKHRFWADVYDGAKLFYLSGLIHGRYSKTEILNLARFISVLKFRPIVWRATHSYVLADRIEDVTHPQLVHDNPAVDRTVAFYGYVRGAVLQNSAKVHIPGAGDFFLSEADVQPDDPCPLPERFNSKDNDDNDNDDNDDGAEKTKKKATRQKLNEKEQRIYAPMADIGNMSFDNQAMYIRLEGENIRFTRELTDPNDTREGEGEQLVKALQDIPFAVDQRLEQDDIQIFDSLVPFDQSRRRAAPEHDNDDDDGKAEEYDDDDDDDDDDSDESDHSDYEQDQDFYISDEDSDEEDGGDDEEAAVHSTHWKEQMLARAERMFTKSESPSVRLRRMVYGSPDDNDDDSDDNDDDVDDDEEEFFRVVARAEIPPDAVIAGKQKKKTTTNQRRQAAADDDKGECQPDNKFVPSVRQLRSLSVLKLLETNDHIDDDDVDEHTLIPASGVIATEKYTQSSDDDDNDDDDDETDDEEEEDEHDDDAQSMFDQLRSRFVAVESTDALVYDESKGQGFVDLEAEGDDNDDDEAKERERRKIEKKAKFDAMYDAGITDFGVADGESTDGQQERKGKKKKKKGDDDDDDDDEASYFSKVKEAMLEQQSMDQAAFTTQERARYVGMMVGAYVRLVIRNVPCELVRFFDPRYPVILGALLPNEYNLGFTQARIKKHRWHRKILKTQDPLVVSLGWRRFQTIPVYHTEDRGTTRQRMLKYTPEHMHCSVTFYAPVTPPNTGFLCAQKTSNSHQNFRICATGVTLDIDQNHHVVKKLKLTGYPMERHNKTAMISGMFNSSLEVAKFVGAKIRTVSGIRGQIKKALRTPPGAFRATFEDRLRKSDIVFLRSYFPVDIPKFYNPVTSLLLSEKHAWQGMKQIRDVRYEHGVAPERRKDSEYRDIPRPVIRPDRPVKISKELQARLPFHAKPQKQKAPRAKPLDASSVVIVDPKQQSVASLLQQLSALKNKRVAIRSERRKENKKRLAELAREEQDRKLTMIKEEKQKQLKRQKRS